MVTFRDTTHGAAGLFEVVGRTNAPGSVNFTPVFPGRGAPAMPPGVAGTPVGGMPGAPSSARDYELLGDLHLKQQQYKEAVDAYERALKVGPADAGGAYVVTTTDEDVDSVHERAVAAGATSVRPPEDQDYGGRGCTFTDPWGVHWSFGSYRGEG